MLGNRIVSLTFTHVFFVYQYIIGHTFSHFELQHLLQILIRILHKGRFFCPLRDFELPFCVIVPYVKVWYYNLHWNNEIVQ